jgi:hypothetical protein
MRELTAAAMDLSTATIGFLRQTLLSDSGLALPRTVDNRKHHNLAALLMNFVDDNLGTFD